MDRETKTIEIERHKFEVKTYATARETQAIQAALFKNAKVGMVGDQPKIDDFSPSIQDDMSREMIRQIVISVDDKTENILELCLDSFPSHIYDQLVLELDAIVSKKKS